MFTEVWWSTLFVVVAILMLGRLAHCIGRDWVKGKRHRRYLYELSKEE